MTISQQIDRLSHELCLTNQPEFCDLDKIEMRTTVLGHIQRSGIPSSYDRLLAATFAKKAVDLIADEKYNQLVVWQNGEVQIQPLDKVVSHIQQCHQLGICPSPVDGNGFLVQTARSLGIYLGFKSS
jgi:ATP-dependent phosphofructokinase / diphosphate-dependent phosphofructokinase